MKKFLLCSLLISSTFYGMNVPDLNRQLFTHIYNYNLWGSFESRSGKGSSIYRTREIRRVLPELITRLTIKTILDVGCGDFNWMRTIDFTNLDHYTGFDIVDDLIYDNIIRFQDSKLSFFCADIANDTIPKADLVLERDCMMHLPDIDLMRFINNIKHSNSKYLLATTFPSTEHNTDFSEKETYQSTRITRRNLQAVPFNFPAPIEMFDEGYEGQCIALWRVEDLPFFHGVK